MITHVNSTIICNLGTEKTVASSRDCHPRSLRMSSTASTAAFIPPGHPGNTHLVTISQLILLSSERHTTAEDLPVNTFGLPRVALTILAIADFKD
jgi:hypothetical protein